MPLLSQTDERPCKHLELVWSLLKDQWAAQTVGQIDIQDRHLLETFLIVFSGAKIPINDINILIGCIFFTKVIRGDDSAQKLIDEASEYLKDPGSLESFRVQFINHHLDLPFDERWSRLPYISNEAIYVTRLKHGYRPTEVELANVLTSYSLYNQACVYANLGTQDSEDKAIESLNSFLITKQGVIRILWHVYSAADHDLRPLHYRTEFWSMLQPFVAKRIEMVIS